MKKARGENNLIIYTIFQKTKPGKKGKGKKRNKGGARDRGRERWAKQVLEEKLSGSKTGASQPSRERRPGKIENGAKKRTTCQPGPVCQRTKKGGQRGGKQ